jgi:hypothetical protein
MKVVKGKRAWYVISENKKRKFRTESEAVAFASADKEAEMPMENTDAVREGNLWFESGSSEEEEAGEEAWQEVDDEA